MRKLVVITNVLFLIQFSVLAQTLKLEKNQIIIGAIDSIYSEILGENRPIWIYMPRSAENSQKKTPVLYLLDGDAHFYSITGMIRQLSVVNGNTLSPEMIVVAIPNTDRTRDLTPSTVKYFPNSGGAEKFTAFIEKELIPFIDKKYPTSPYRTLVGHSWGGLFVLNTLIHHAALFDNYVTIDPTIKWDNQSFLNKACLTLEKEKFNRKSLYLGVANRIPKGLDLNSVVNDTSNASEHMRAMLRFTKISEQASELNFEWGFYQNDNHNGVPLIATYDAIRFLFQWYNFNEEIIFGEALNMSTKELVDMITAHYENIAQHFGYSVLPPERLINRFGDILMYEIQYEKAFALYSLNANNYPKSFRVYDALGDYFGTQNEHDKAIDFFEQSLKIEETERTRRKLNDMIESK